MGGITSKVLAASAGRDRVMDAIKALALLLVIAGHSLAWTVTSDGSVINTLDAAPYMFPLTWVLQILPLFFLLAGAGLTRLSGSREARGYLGRLTRLSAPALPLIAITVVLALAASAIVGADAARAAGVLPVQLVWFLGVYLVLVAAAPLLVRCSGPWAVAIWLVVILGVDLLRVNVNELIGWANLILVWGLFAAIGTRLDRLRTIRPSLLVLGTIVFASGAIFAIVVGPYSPALISTDAVEGISNLAPPTIVLALVGLAQICLLLLLWSLLQRALDHDRLWVPVAIFASRAMEIYLWHMLVFTVAIAGMIGLGIAPAALSLLWWLQHLAVATVVLAVVWFAAPGLGRLSRGLAGWLGSISPRLPLGTAWARVLLVVAAVTLLCVSESGVAQPITARVVLLLPYMPLAGLALLAIVVGLATKASVVVDDVSRSDGLR
ncbi:MAG: acyltransferase [Actinobacteria bacterium]|nr:acyltransferase [Actinomycetota bacterium]